jgi:hypothetical protein
VKAVKGYGCEDARGCHLPHLEVDVTDRGTVIFRKSGQGPDDGIELRKLDVYNLAQWLVNEALR